MPRSTTPLVQCSKNYRENYHFSLTLLVVCGKNLIDNYDCRFAFLVVEVAAVATPGNSAMVFTLGSVCWRKPPPLWYSMGTPSPAVRCTVQVRGPSARSARHAIKEQAGNEPRRGPVVSVHQYEPFLALGRGPSPRRGSFPEISVSGASVSNPLDTFVHGFSE